MNRSLVPYGCWFRKSNDTGIYINLGSSILNEDRGRLFDLLKTPDRTDTYFCSKALQQGYTSIVTNFPPKTVDLGSETIICYVQSDLMLHVPVALSYRKDIMHSIHAIVAIQWRL
jgi:hypothetical protein